MLDTSCNIIKINTIDELGPILIGLAETDADFNGENGCLWEEAEACGYESNAEYAAEWVLSHAKETGAEVASVVKEFADMWMKYDGYYDEYSVNVAKLEANSDISGTYAIFISSVHLD